MNPRTSTPCLSIHLPTEDGHPILFSAVQDRRSEPWTHKPGTLSEAWRTAALWQKIEQAESNPRAVLTEAGAALGGWLFDERASSHLRQAVLEWQSDHDSPLRVALHVPRSLAEYPWEIASLENIPHLAAHHALAAVRVSDAKTRATTLPSILTCQIIGVQHDTTQAWHALQTDRELTVIRTAIENACGRHRLSVHIDRGDWPGLVKHYRRTDAPHIFHFAGHGLEDGGGLVFRGKAGEPIEIMADQVAQTLSRSTGKRQTQLAFLNACTTTATGKGPTQPFGGVGELLIQHGIPMVVGLQTPVGDTEAIELAQVFYAAICRGESADCALQEAREQLFLLSTDGVGWAFLNLLVAGQPTPLCDPLQQADLPPAARKVLLAFGHDEQRQRLAGFLMRKQPTVVVVQGEERSGHRHVLERLQDDLEHDNVLWSPVATLHLRQAGSPFLLRMQLAGGIARTLGIDDTGSQDELEARLAETIADRCADNRVVVIDVQEVVKFRTAEHAHAFRALIQDLWVDVMDTAAAYRSSLPVFLLTAVAYPNISRYEYDSSAATERPWWRRVVKSLVRDAFFQAPSQPASGNASQIERQPRMPDS